MTFLDPLRANLTILSGIKGSQGGFTSGCSIQVNAKSSELIELGQGGDGNSWCLGAEYQEAIERFVTSLTGKSKHTKLIYRQGASHFLGFLDERWRTPTLEALNREHADTWVAFLLEETDYRLLHGLIADG